MKQLYEILNNLKPGKEYELLTVLSGACAGQRFAVRSWDMHAAWSSAEAVMSGRL